MKTRHFWLLPALLLSLSALGATDSANAKKNDEARPILHDFGSTWAQGGPYSMNALAGKIAVLYFYEEG